MSEVTDALQALVDGELTIDDVEAQFRTRIWPLVAPEHDDGTSPEGSFGEVSDAYSKGLISHDQYVRLAAVVIEVMKHQPDREDQP